MVKVQSGQLGTQEEAVPLDALPVPRVLELAASNAPISRPLTMKAQT